MKTYNASFIGRELGAIGSFSRFIIEVKGENEWEALMEVYKTHDHLKDLTLTDISPDRSGKLIWTLQDIEQPKDDKAYTVESKRHLESIVGHTIAFKEATSFADIFETAVPYVKGSANDQRRSIKGKTVSSYCTVSGGEQYRSFSVKPQQRVMDYIGENMLDIAYDSIYFTVTIRDDGSALLAAQYNQIIGSRWLAIVDASTIPTQEVDQ
jgi:hypothetical protein